MKPDIKMIRVALLAATTLGASFAQPALGQSTPAAAPTDENVIVVTAQRREELLQDVPISISVFSQNELLRRNVSNATDLAAITPSLSTNQTFGSDNSSYAIRGFGQTQRTTASVGVFFAEVVAQRAGQTAVTAGDGAGPGAFFDLENVQVLKGPQGTLFGRNTTGGAIMLTPKKPVGRVEGYVEASAGNYDMYRFQGVINLPLGDHARFRFGAEYNNRRGYQNVVSGVGPSHLGAVKYLTGRASLVLDLDASLENYTIGSFTRSRGTSTVLALFACNPSTTLNVVARVSRDACVNQLGARKYGFYDVGSRFPDAISNMNSWQVINTTTWKVTDDLTVKNIFAYGSLDTSLKSALYGNDFRIPTGAAPFQAAVAGLPFSLGVNPNDGGKMTDQRNLVEELQFQGRSGDRFVWQGGLYYEHSIPGSFAGNIQGSTTYCPDNGNLSTNPAQMRCQDVISQYVAAGTVAIGQINVVRTDLTFENKAAYGQATYKLADKLSLTGGFRYTWDKTKANHQQIVYTRFPTLTLGPPAVTRCFKTTAVLPNCLTYYRQKSSAPTWLIDLDYHPIDNVLLYAKWTRGYRQGSIIAIGAEPRENYGPEKVDAYELGLKTSFHGALSGYFNVAAFYNNLKDQQLQVGAANSQGLVNPTTFIANAGRSRIYGLEIDTRISLFKGFSLDAGYTYLNTKVVKTDPVSLPAGGIFDIVVPSANKGDQLPFTPRHKVVLGANYVFPIAPSAGRLSIGGNYVHTSKTFITTAQPFGTTAGYGVANLNVDWKSVGGFPVDASFFVTNLLDKEYATMVTGFYQSSGVEYRGTGLPRMWGFRLRYNLGR